MRVFWGRRVVFIVLVTWASDGDRIVNDTLVIDVKPISDAFRKALCTLPEDHG